MRMVHIPRILTHIRKGKMCLGMSMYNYPVEKTSILDLPSPFPHNIKESYVKFLEHLVYKLRRTKPP